MVGPVVGGCPKSAESADPIWIHYDYCWSIEIDPGKDFLILLNPGRREDHGTGTGGKGECIFLTPFSKPKSLF